MDRKSDIFRLQFVLARLDCFDGSIDGQWSLAFHERLAHVVLMTELDLDEAGSVDTLLATLEDSDPGICASREDQSASRLQTATPAVPALLDADAPDETQPFDIAEAVRELPLKTDELEKTAHVRLTPERRHPEQFAIQPEVAETRARHVANVEDTDVIEEVSIALTSSVIKAVDEEHAPLTLTEAEDTAAPDHRWAALDAGDIADAAVPPTYRGFVSAREMPVRYAAIDVVKEPESVLSVEATPPTIPVATDSEVVAVTKVPVPQVVSSRGEPLPLPTRRLAAVKRVFGTDVVPSPVRSREKPTRRQRTSTRRAKSKPASSAKPAAKPSKPEPKMEWKKNRKAIFYNKG